jgi:hypothetical protein
MNNNTILGLGAIGLFALFLYKNKKKSVEDIANEVGDKFDKFGDKLELDNQPIPSNEDSTPYPSPMAYPMYKPNTYYPNLIPTTCQVLGTCIVGRFPQSDYDNLMQFNGSFVIATYPDGREVNGIMNVNQKIIISQERPMSGNMPQTYNIGEMSSIRLQNNVYILGKKPIVKKPLERLAFDLRIPKDSKLILT